MTERDLVKEIKKLVEERKIDFVKKVFTHLNLGTTKFNELWKDWWSGEAPPRMEVDMIFVFLDYDGVMIPSVEVKFFREKEKFYYGIEQALAYSLFGFDSIVLWHIFDQEMKNNVVEGFVRAVEELVRGFEIPLVYFATKIYEGMEFEFFSPWKLYSSKRSDIEYVLMSMKNICKNMKNPLLLNEEVKQRRNVLKTILKIPV